MGTRWLIATAAMASACSFHGRGAPDAGTISDATDAGIDAAPAAWLVDYAHRKAIVITGGATTLDEFPTSIAATDPDLVGATGLVFTAADGITLLPSEIVDIDANTGAIDAWVRSSLPGGATTTVYLYYGGPARSPLTPWSTGYAGVWHMSGTGSTLADSTAHRHDAIAPSGGKTPAAATGIIGAARSFDGIDDTTNTADPADGSLDFGVTSFTYALWVNVTASTTNGFDLPFHKGGTSAGDPGYDMELGTGVWNAEINDGTNHAVLYGNEVAFLGRWVDLTTVVDRQRHQMITYVDGVAITKIDITGFATVDSTRGLSIGYAGYPFRGLIDEVRVYTTPLSPEWIAAEHRNAADRASFVTIGPAEGAP